MIPHIRFEPKRHDAEEVSARLHAQLHEDLSDWRGWTWRRQRIAQVGIEIRQARAVDNEIEMLAKFFVGSERKSQVWLSDVAFHHFDFFPDESRQIQAISRVERIKNWRFLDHLFETVDGWVRFLAAD